MSIKIWNISNTILIEDSTVSADRQPEVMFCDTTIFIRNNDGDLSIYDKRFADALGPNKVFPYTDLLDRNDQPFASAKLAIEYLASFIGVKYRADVQGLVTTLYKKYVDLRVDAYGIPPKRPILKRIANTVISVLKITDEIYYGCSADDFSSGPLTVIIEFAPLASEVGKSVNFQLDYLTHNLGDDASTTTGTLQSGDVALNETANTTQIYEFTIPEEDVKEEIHLKLSRIALTLGSDPATDPGVIHVHCKYQAILSL